MITAAHKELHSVIDIYSIPSFEELEYVNIHSLLQWMDIQNFTQVHPQTDESYTEKRLAVQSCIYAIDQYISGPAIFVKNRIIVGSPGCEKSFLMNYIMLHELSKGLKVERFAMLVRPAIHLGGLHIHKLFGIIEKSDASIHKTAEIGIQRILS